MLRYAKKLRDLVYINRSINQSNIYSANIPGVVRLSGATNGDSIGKEWQDIVYVEAQMPGNGRMLFIFYFVSQVVSNVMLFLLCCVMLCYALAVRCCIVG